MALQRAASQRLAQRVARLARRGEGVAAHVQKLACAESVSAGVGKRMVAPVAASAEAAEWLAGGFGEARFGV